MATLSIEMNAPAKPSLRAESRNAGIDALRASLTLLVLFHHSAVTYGAMGSWFYQEIEPSHAPSSLILTLFAAYNQAFFMGLFFLIAGSLTPGAMARHGAAQYLRERLIRLGAPLLIFILVLGPITVALAQTVKGRSFFATLGLLARRGAIILGPMWFVWALLIFAGAYLVLRAAIGAERLERARPFPSNAVLAASALATGAAAFLLRLRWPTGAEAIGLQIGYFASYVVLFAAGCLGAKGRWLENVPPNQLVRWRRISIIAALALPAALIAVLSLPGASGPPNGGWTMLAVFYAFREPFFAWGVILALLVFFRAISPPSARSGAISRDRPSSSTSSIRRSWSACRSRCAASPPPRW